MTKDEFLDIMGDIDGKLIESTLDISHMETVELPYERPPVFRYVLGVAACAAVFVTVLAVRFFNGISPLPSGGSESCFSSESSNVAESSSDGLDSLDSLDSSTESTINPNPDFIRGWNPDDYHNSGHCAEVGLGETAAFSTAYLDGIQATLILHDITKLPGEKYFKNGHDYTDYYGAKDIVLYVTDNKGNKTLEESVSPHRSDGITFIHKNCFLGNGTRIFKTESGGEHYIIMQTFDYNEEKGAPIARFYECDFDIEYGNDRFDENGISVFGLIWYEVYGFGRIGGWKYGYQVSDEFIQSGDTTFTDPVYDYKVSIKPNNSAAYIITPDCAAYQDENVDYSAVTGWDPEALPYNPYPGVGESAVVSRAELDGIEVELIMINVIKRPGESHYIYSDNDYLDLWIADNICLYIKDRQGRRVLSHLPTPWTTGFVKFLPKECLYDGSTKVFSLERDGELDYVIMQYCGVVPGEDGISLRAAFVSGDMELYTSTAEKDENGISKGEGLKPITPRGTIVASSDGSLEMSEDGILYDRIHGYYMTF